MEIRPYLCGPIFGCSDEEAKAWRELAKRHFPNAIDPMARDYRGREDVNWDEIVYQDKLAISGCSCVLANVPRPSFGSAMEILFAWELGKPVFAVAAGPVSPWLRYHATAVFPTLEAAIERMEARFA